MSKALIQGIAFTTLPVKAQTLYHEMCACANEDDFVTVEMIGVKPKDKYLEILTARKFVIAFKKGWIIVRSNALRECLLSDASEQITAPIKKNQPEQTTMADGVEVNVIEEFIKIYKNYPCSISKSKKNSLNLYYGWLTGKKITVMGERKNIKYNHLEILFALKKFIDDKNGTEEQFIPRLPTFLGERLLCDYATASRKAYEAYMQRKFGDGWRDIRFVYNRGNL